MEIFFYCTYQHSARGFFLTHLEDATLRPAEGSVPKVVRDFFSYERFRFLWKNLSPGEENCSWTKSAGAGRKLDAAFCGIGYLRGTMADGRSGVANLAFLADEREKPLLRNTVLCILGDYPAFESQVFQWLSVGGICSYQLYAEPFLAWLRRCGEAKGFQRLTPPLSFSALLLRRLERSGQPRAERGRFQFAVYTGNWEQIAKVENPSRSVRLKPMCVLSEKTFKRVFYDSGNIWKPIFQEEKGGK